MLDTLLAKVVGTQNERELKRLRPLVAEIGALEPSIQALTDEQLRGKTAEFRARIAQGETLDDLLVEAFARIKKATNGRVNLKSFPTSQLGSDPELRASLSLTALTATTATLVTVLLGARATAVELRVTISSDAGSFSDATIAAVDRCSRVVEKFATIRTCVRLLPAEATIACTSVPTARVK